MKCPMCKGKGELDTSENYKNTTKVRKELALKLYFTGNYSLREIAKMVGVSYNAVWKYIQ